MSQRDASQVGGVSHTPTHRPPARPTGLLKVGYNLPILLYRARLGWLLGHRFLLLTHQGRLTGKVHHTVAEVVRYDVSRQESIVLSAYGTRADWYQNIHARPPLEVRTGRTRYVPRMRLLGADERLADLAIYQRRYRRASRAVIRWLGYPYDGTEASLRALAEQVVMVGFRPPDAFQGNPLGGGSGLLASRVQDLCPGRSDPDYTHRATAIRSAMRWWRWGRCRSPRRRAARHETHLHSAPSRPIIVRSPAVVGLR